MIGPLVRRNFRHLRGLTVTLVIGLVAFTVVIIRVAAAFERGTGLAEMLEMLPPMLRNFAGAQIGAVWFGAFVAFAFQHPASVVSALAYVIVVATTVAGERDDGTLDLILARPVRRRSYLAAIVATMGIGAVLLPLGMLLGLAIGLATVDAPDELPWTRYITGATGLMTLLLAIGGFSLLVAAGARRRGVAVVRTLTVVLTLYVIEVFADLWSPLATVRWMSPFHYFKPIPAALGQATPGQDALILLAVFAITTALAFAVFRRRDA